MRTAAFALFAVLMFATLGGMHWYLWARLARDTGLSRPWRRSVAVALALAGASVPLWLLFVRTTSFRSPRPLAMVLFSWLGFSFLLFVALVLTDFARVLWAGGKLLAATFTRDAQRSDPPQPSRRAFVARAAASGAVLVAGGESTIALLSAMDEPLVREVPVELERLPRALSGFTLAHITDLHVGPTIGASHVRRVVELTNRLRPDAVVITGDLVDGSVAELRRATEELARLEARHGLYFVTGNHEYYSGVRPWLAELERYGVRPIQNGRVSLGDRAPGGASFDLAGVDDWSVARGARGRWPALEVALVGRDPDRSLVLLAHQPRGVEDAVRSGVELQMSGHTHGGQLFPFHMAVGAIHPYSRGLYRHREGTMQGSIYVSCGTGYWGPPMRLGAPAEIAKIVLTRS